MMLPFVFRLIIATLLLFSGLMPVQLTAQFTGEKQPFETGKWIQLQVNQGGFFRIGYQDLLNYGFNPAQINPKTIRLFLSQGAGYPDLNVAVTSSAPEAAIYVHGETDAKFDVNDYIIFYVEPLVSFEADNMRFKRNRHQYAKNITAYIGTNNQTLGKRIALANEAAVNDLPIIYGGCVMNLFETDLLNPLGMGRVWLGEKLGNETLSRNYATQIPNGVDSTWLQFRIGASMIDETGWLYIRYGLQQFNVFLRRNNSGDEPVYTQEFQLQTAEFGSFPLELSLNRKNSQSAAYLDYLQFQSFGKHEKVNSLDWFYPQLKIGEIKNGAQFEFSGEVAERLVWDVSNPYAPVQLFATLRGANQQYHHPNPRVSAHLAVQTISQMKSPVFLGAILPSLVNELIAPTLYIVNTPFANVLKSQDWANINPDSKIVLIQDIYNQYSGGEPDLGAIRAYLRFLHAFYKDANGNPILKYVTLVGAASYDFFDRLPGNTNFIPIYQSLGEQKTSNYSLDDYIGYLTEGQGDLNLGQSKLDVVIGRIPARTESEVAQFFEKRKNYASPKTLGAWRSRITFVTDDIDEAWEKEFTYESEDYARYIAKNHPYLRVNRIFADAFVQKTNGNNEAYPDVNTAIKKSFEEGSLFVNYQGHGGETGWGQEAFFDIPTINSLNNPYRIPVLFTATCEFSRFDNPALQSAGEKTLFRKNGGAIALMTTTRTVWVSGNTIINNAFWKNYGFPKPNESVPTLGDLYGRLKNRPRLNSEDNKFALLGDPSMKLAFPEHVVVLDTINGAAFDQFSDTLKAFSVIRVSGHVNERLKGLLDDFNGELEVEIFDKPVQQFTLDNDKEGINVPFESESSVIFKGKVSVIKGRFEFAFAIPKDISYQIGNGRCVFYAQDGKRDAAGFWEFKIGGSSPIQELDTIGPKIRAFMGDTMFVNGGQVQSESNFVALVYDKNGLNATGAGIGRDMVLTIDPGTESEASYVVNEFFNYDANSYQQGYIKFPLKDLSPGHHTAHLKVWDIYNNSGNGIVDFEVGPARELIISGSSAFPNPTNSLENLRFSLNHNMPNEDLNASISIYNIGGVRVFESETFIWSAPSKLILPEGQDNWFGGIDLPAGLYVYHLKLSTQDGLSDRVAGKLIKQ
jgi:hypothetical protein